MQDLNDLYLFAKVVEHRGFAAAGRALGLPKSKLSRRIAALEERLGVRLIQRSTRRFAVTEIGQNYHRHCLAVVAEAEAAQEAVDRVRTEPQGQVRLSCPGPLLQSHVGAMLTAFMAAHPRVRLHAEATMRRVDVIEEGFDLALRVRIPPLDDSDLVVRPLAPSAHVLVGAPSLFAGRRPPQTPADLAAFDSLDLPASGEHLWRLRGPDGTLVAVPHLPRLVTEDMETLRRAAVAGLGLVRLPQFLVQDDLADGALVAVLTDWNPPAGLIHAVFPSRRGLVPAVRSLIDHLAAGFAEG
ncbi:LysR substrate-binding domain-containing protein [Azospirillum sp. ST 5-10]|uniref:LysR substrate-binding domain-containing protein n=1 Tax=unclassified Azospirillum TaxID=2630922 RepID=UPI003F4A1C5B